MTLKGILMVVLVFSTMTAFGYWRYQSSSQQRPVAQFEFIQDPSDSIPTDCDRTVSLAKRVLSMNDAGSGSTITLFALGDEQSANEPRLLGEFKFPVIRRVIEGQRANERAQDELLASVRNRCETVHQTRVSPIFEGLKRGVEHLQNAGSPADSRYLFIQTDGEETENAQIKKALNDLPGMRLKLPNAIDNKGMHITFCGMAETIGTINDKDRKVHHMSKRRDDNRADRLREVWLKLFAYPQMVTFEPFCSR